MDVKSECECTVMGHQRMRVSDSTMPRHNQALSQNNGHLSFERCPRTDGNMQSSPPILVGDAKTNLSMEIRRGATARNFPSNTFFLPNF